VGDYLVVAENEAGKAETTCKVFIKALPSIDDRPMVNPDAFKNLQHQPGMAPEEESEAISPPVVIIPLTDSRVGEGRSVTLMCKIEGSPKPRCTWFKNDEPLMASQRIDMDFSPSSCIATLIIKDLKTIDEGVFKCVGENAAGKADTSCRLSVEIGPNVDETPFIDPEAFTSFEGLRRKPQLPAPVPIDREPFLSVKDLKDNECKEGESVTFVCEVRGHPKPVIEWTKDGAPLKLSQRFFTDYFMNEGRAVLIIQDVKVDDAGKYTVTARNDAGVGSADAQLKVSLVPAIDERSYVNPDAFSKFENKDAPKPDDESGAAGEPRLKIVEPYQDFYLIEGAEAFFKCKIDANPKAVVHWFKDDQPLMASERFLTQYDPISGFAVLRIKSSLRGDKGTYKCTAANEVGSDETSAKLVIQEEPSVDDTSYINPNALRALQHAKPVDGEDPAEIYKKPYFIKVPKNTEVRVGTPVRFDCIAFGRPEPELTWYKDGQPIKDDPNHKV
jgi:hypothetical protein